MRNMNMAVVVGAIAISVAGQPGFGKDLIYASFLGPTHYVNEKVMPGVFDRIARATDGATTFEMALGGALSGAFESLDGVSNGSLDTSALVYSYTPSLTPALAFVGELPSTDQRVAMPALNETILLNCPQCLEEMAEQNAVFLLTNSSIPFNLHCAGVEIARPEDLDGIKVRASGSMATFLAEMGAVPTSINFAEIFTALQRGQLDCHVAPIIDQEVANLAEVTDHVTDLPLGNFNAYANLAVNGDIWRGLGGEEQTIWLDAVAMGLADDLTFSHRSAAEVRQRIVDGDKVKLVTPDPSFAERLAMIKADALPRQIAEAEGRGVRDAAGLADHFALAQKKWQGIFDQVAGGDGVLSDSERAEYGARIKAEIYDRFSFE